ncbi:hypothetical protein M2138_001060 [Dysgonomonadaceae bacterium PH5-43]|nr:hypothetical protein [Dysgonomonadaceae bacterium PH5-43]
MVFILLVATAIFLYVWGYKVISLVIFFFFLTNGFELIQLETFEFNFIAVGTDYALIILYAILAIETIFTKNFFKIDNLVKCMMVFGGFIAIAVIYSKFIIGASFFEILKVCRPFLFLPLHFLFRTLKLSQIEELIKYLFTITVATSTLYLMQIFTDTFILAGDVKTSTYILGTKIMRYYNQPSMLYFLTFIAIFNNPYKGWFKFVSTVILVAALIGAFHRSLLSSFAVALIVSFIVTLPRLRQIQILTLACFLVFFGSIYFGGKFMKSKTYNDIQIVLSEDIAEMVMSGDFSFDGESTFAYRVAHLGERHLYVSQKPMYAVLGIGLFSDYSPCARSLEFRLGLIGKITNEIEQIHSPDISYSSMLLHFGYVGSLTLLLIYAYLAVFFYKHRKTKYALASFAYLVLSFGTSFFSENLVQAMTFVLPVLAYTTIKKINYEQEHKSIDNNTVL